MTGRNPFQSSAQDWDDMREALQVAEEGRRHSDQLSIRLMADNDALVIQLDSVNSRLNFWMGYAIQIETRLDVITGVIQDARNEAKDAAKRYASEVAPHTVAEQKPPPQPGPASPKRTLQDLIPQRRRPVEVRHSSPPNEDESGPSAQDIVASLPQRLSNTWP